MGGAGGGAGSWPIAPPQTGNARRKIESRTIRKVRTAQSSRVIFFFFFLPCSQALPCRCHVAESGFGDEANEDLSGFAGHSSITGLSLPPFRWSRLGDGK